MMKSGLKRPVMSSTCAAISTPGAGTAKVLSSKPSDLRKVLEDDERLLAGRVVIVEIGDLLALEAAAQLLLGEVDGGRALRPVAGGDREQIGVALAVGGRGRAEARRGAEDLVLLELLGQRRGLRRAVDALEHRAFLLEALVRLHRRRHLVLVVDLDDLDLVALDAALAVDAGRCSHGSRGRGARRRVCVAPVRSHCRPNTISFSCARAAPAASARAPAAIAAMRQLHVCSSLVSSFASLLLHSFSTRMARPGSSCGYCAIGG